MQCRSCGLQVQEDMRYCPSCGNLLTSPSSPNDSSPYAPTMAAQSYEGMFQEATPPPPPDAAQQASPYPYQQNAYTYYNNPYDVSTAIPAVPEVARTRRSSGPWLIVGVLVFVVVLIGAGGAWLLISTQQPAGKQHLPLAATPETLPYHSYRGSLVIDDQLNTGGSTSNWLVTSDSNGSCAYTSAAYHVSTTKGGYFYPCAAQNATLTNFVLEVQMEITQGDCGAILFRMDTTNTDFYYFRVCQDGSYGFFRYKNNNGTNLIAPYIDPSVHTGLNQSNVVAIAAQGSQLDFYINHQHVGSITDTTYTAGSIALVADGYPNNHATEVAYTHLKAWKL